MKKILFLFLILSSCTTSVTSKNKNMNLIITIRNKEFTATLNDSEATQEFVKLLPMEVSMNEHNGNEKYYNLPKSIPGKAFNPGRIATGDLMIWSSSTFVLFYDNFSPSYSYIRLGKIDNPSGLNQAVGRESVKVKFELKKDKEESENTQTENKQWNRQQKTNKVHY